MKYKQLTLAKRYHIYPQGAPRQLCISKDLNNMKQQKKLEFIHQQSVENYDVTIQVF